MSNILETSEWENTAIRLKEPLPNISYRIANPPKADSKTHMVTWDTLKNYEILAYIDARDVMDRLDEVVGVGGWQDSYKVLNDDSVECTLTILGVSKVDVGERTNFADMKGGYSDAFKRAAVKFGIGRFLYDLPKKWSKVDQRGKPINSPANESNLSKKKISDISTSNDLKSKICEECGKNCLYRKYKNKNGDSKEAYVCADWKYGNGHTYIKIV